MPRPQGHPVQSDWPAAHPFARLWRKGGRQLPTLLHSLAREAVSDAVPFVIENCVVGVAVRGVWGLRHPHLDHAFHQIGTGVAERTVAESLAIGILLD